MLRWETSVQGAGLNEKRLLNHDRFGEGPDVLDEDAPDRSGENDTGSMVTRDISACDQGENNRKVKGEGGTRPTLLLLLEHAEGVLASVG
jgi:hypothetical protein